MGCEPRGADGSARSENRLLQILPDREAVAPATIRLEHPFTTFYTATERGGCAPSVQLDLYGAGREATVLRCARIRLPED